MRLAKSRDLVQRPAGQPAAEHGIDLRHAQGESRRAVFQAGRTLERTQTLAKFLEHAISL